MINNRYSIGDLVKIKGTGQRAIITFAGNKMAFSSKNPEVIQQEIKYSVYFVDKKVEMVVEPVSEKLVDDDELEYLRACTYDEIILVRKYIIYREGY